MRRSIARWSLITVAIVCAAVALNRGFRAYDSVMNVKAYDLLIDWSGAKLIAQGMNPFTDEAMKTVGLGPQLGLAHPPTVYFWFLPLADLDLQTAKRVWNLATILFLFLLLVMVVGQLGFPAPLVTAPLLLGVVMCTSWMIDHFRVSQLSCTIAFLYVVAWHELRQRRDIVAGIALGIATTFKFYPGAVVLLLFLIGRRRAAIAAGAIWMVAAIVATVRFGFMCWPRFLELTKPYTVYWMSHLKNASLQGIFQRFHYRTCAYAAAHHQVWKPGSYLSSFASLLLIALSWWVSRPERAAPGAPRTLDVEDKRGIDLPFALFTLVSLVTGPYYWEHYHVTLVLPLAIAAVALVQARRRRLACWWVGAGAAAIGVTLFALAVDFQLKLNLWDAYHYRKPPPSHFVLHFFEVLSFIGAPLLIALFALLLVWERKRARGAFVDLRLPAF